MMGQVLRVQLDITLYQAVMLPLGAKLLHVAPSSSGEEINLWFWNRGFSDRIDTESQEVVPAKRVATGLYIVATNDPMPKALNSYAFHIGTCVMPCYLVWHVFEGPVQP